MDALLRQGAKLALKTASRPPPLATTFLQGQEHQTGDLVSGTSLGQKDPAPASRSDGKETVHDKLQWSLAGEEEKRETEMSFITSELAVIHLLAQGGEDISSLSLQVAVGRGRSRGNHKAERKPEPGDPEPEELYSGAAGQSGQGEVPGTAAGVRPAAQGGGPQAATGRGHKEAGQCRQLRREGARQGGSGGREEDRGS